MPSSEVRAKFVSGKEYFNMMRKTEVCVFVEPALLEELVPKEYKRLMYLVSLFNISGTKLKDIYKYGNDHLEGLTEENQQVFYAVVELEMVTRDLFGEIVIGKPQGIRSCVFYVEFDLDRMQDYQKYNMKVIPDIGEM